VRLSDARADLVREGIDLAIRIGDLQDSTLVARRFAGQQLVLVAAPDYLRRHGAPAALEDLAAHRHIVYRLPSSGRDRPQEFRVGRRTVEMHPARSARFSDGEAIVQAALLGLGLAQVPDNMADAELAAGRLVELLPQHRPPEMPIHAVMPAQRMVPARVRALLDLLHEWDAPAAPAAPKARHSPSKR
jgi:LysR family transcriptional regulator for bpeEF and oprC